MSKPRDAAKREEWLRRLDRFESMELSISRFCRGEGVATHTFHYWRKQLGRKSRRNGRSRNGNGGSSLRLKQCAAVESAASESKTAKAKAEAASSSKSVVHFTWDSRLSVSVPADCLDAIRCVLEYASHERSAGSQDASPAVSAFRQVITD